MAELSKVLAQGERIAERYRIERRLGVGGMGEVYAAHHELLGKSVAIKVMRPEIAESAQAVRRFLNEARASVQIESEHVARVLDVATLPSGAPFMVMDLLEGRDLADLLEAQGRVQPDEAVDFVLQALDALAEAHALGIVHRDVKPANLFVAQRRDGTATLKVLDFGIAKAVAGLNDITLTQSNTIVGSPAYMAPEQIRQSKHVDARADIWSVGVVLFELLTGRLPFEAETVGALFFAISEQTPPLASALREDVPVELAQVVARCITRKPEERFQSAGELGMALAPFSGGRAAASVERLRRARLPVAVKESEPVLPASPTDRGGFATAQTMLADTRGRTARLEASPGSEPDLPVARAETPRYALERPSEPRLETASPGGVEPLAARARRGAVIGAALGGAILVVTALAVGVTRARAGAATSASAAASVDTAPSALPSVTARRAAAEPPTPPTTSETKAAPGAAAGSAVSAPLPATASATIARGSAAARPAATKPSPPSPPARPSATVPSNILERN